MVNNFGVRLLDGLFPNHCALCGLRSRQPQPLCLDCEQEMPRNHHCCTRCAIPLSLVTAPEFERECGNCLHHAPPFDRVIAPWLYGEYFSRLIQLWKFQRDRRLTALLATLWRQQAELQYSIDLLVPVPLHWRRQWRRGFNQSELLGRQLLNTCPELRSCTLADGMVKRQRATPAQSGMNAAQRARNLAGAFTVCGPCDNLRVAIVDDVLTTGATAAAVASALKQAGAAHIEVWCLARTPAPGV